MVDQISNTFRTTYSENVRFTLQQGGQILAPLGMRQDAPQGAESYMLTDIAGDDQMVERKNKNQDNVYGDTTHDRVWVFPPNPGEYIRLVDSQDKIKSGIELTGTYVKGGVRAHNRWWDDTFIKAFYGNMYMGKTGGTAVPFASGNIVPVATGAASATGLNVDKIKAAQQILKQNFVDLDQPFYMAVTARQTTDLLGQVEVTSDDFKQMKGRLSADGKRVAGLLGFEFVEIELSNPLFYNAATTLDGSGYRLNPFWSKDGMCMVPWEEQFSTVDQLPGKGYSTQVYHRTVVTASRTDNGRCGYIRCSEA